MKHLFIINPAAGSRDRTESYTKQIKESCEKRGLDYRIAVSSAPGNCHQLAREAAESGEEYRIYACGGDGTLNEVASGAAGFSNAAVTGTPASMMETNWRQKTAMSRGLGFCCMKLISTSLERALASSSEIRVEPSALSFWAAS